MISITVSFDPLLLFCYLKVKRHRLLDQQSVFAKFALHLDKLNTWQSAWGGEWGQEVEDVCKEGTLFPLHAMMSYRGVGLYGLGDYINHL